VIFFRFLKAPCNFPPQPTSKPLFSFSEAYFFFQLFKSPPVSHPPFPTTFFPRSGGCSRSCQSSRPSFFCVLFFCVASCRLHIFLFPYTPGTSFFFPPPVPPSLFLYPPDRDPRRKRIFPFFKCRARAPPFLTKHTSRKTVDPVRTRFDFLRVLLSALGWEVLTYCRLAPKFVMAISGFSLSLPSTPLGVFPHCPSGQVPDTSPTISPPPRPIF